MKIVNVELPRSKYNVKATYPLENPIGITVHNTANDASARNEIAYMQRNNQYTSFHIAVDDKEAVQGIPFSRNAWHAGDGTNGTGNRKTIAIEICYSKSGGAKFDEAEKNGAKVVAMLLKKYGWGINNVYTHQHWSGKYCPHRTLDRGWNRFLNMVKAEMGGKTNTTTSKPTSTGKSIDAVAREVIRGDWGNGSARKANLEKAGYNYNSVQARVDEILLGKSAPKKTTKSIDAVAREVIRGDWGNGSARKRNLERAGYNYNAVQARVNQLLK